MGSCAVYRRSRASILFLLAAEQPRVSLLFYAAVKNVLNWPHTSVAKHFRIHFDNVVLPRPEARIPPVGSSWTIESKLKDLQNSLPPDIISRSVVKS